MLRSFASVIVIGIFSLSIASCGGGSSTAPEPPPPPPPPWPPAISGTVIPWQDEGCTSTIGPPVALHSSDFGQSFVPHQEAFPGGIDAAVDELVAQPTMWGVMFASSGTTVYRTLSSGCDWAEHFEAAEPIRLVASTFPWLTYGVNERGDRIYTFSDRPVIETELPFHLIDIADTRFSTNYALTTDGRIMRMRFNLEFVLWDEVGPAPTTGTPKFLAVRPDSTPYTPTQMIVAMESGPTWTTLDDGNTWIESTDLVGGATAVQTGKPIFGRNDPPDWDSPVSDLWIYVERTGSTAKRAIAHSSDGGRTFTDVIIDDGATVFLDAPYIAPVPGRPGEVLVSADYCEAGEAAYYHYDLSTDTVTATTVSVPGVIGVETIEFNPSFPDYLYIGPRLEPDC